jgi:hypothetical protein
MVFGLPPVRRSSVENRPAFPTACASRDQRKKAAARNTPSLDIPYTARGQNDAAQNGVNDDDHFRM